MRFGPRLDVRALEMASGAAVYPHDGPSVIGTVLAVRAREVVLVPWGQRAQVAVPRGRVAFARAVEVVHPHEQQRICAAQASAGYGFLEQPASADGRRQRRGRRAA